MYSVPYSLVSDIKVQDGTTLRNGQALRRDDHARGHVDLRASGTPRSYVDLLDRAASYVL